MDSLTPSSEAGHRVLVIDDDDEHNACVAWRLRREGFTVVTATSGGEGLGRIAREPFDIVLLDYYLGDRSGLEVLTAIRLSKAVDELPVIMVTVETDSETTVRALQYGANDFVSKPVDLNVVIARLRSHLAVKTKTGELQQLALHDPLTELPNRALLADRFDGAMGRCNRTGGSMGVILIDLDGFKLVNDHHGHVVGDALLAAVAKRLVNSTRGSDTVGRIGGDEFLVIAEGVQQESEAELIVRRFERAVSQPYEINGIDIRIGASIGAHVWRLGQREDFETAVNLADKAMYRMKRSRRPTA